MTARRARRGEVAARRQREAARAYDDMLKARFGRVWAGWRAGSEARGPRLDGGHPR